MSGGFNVLKPLDSLTLAEFMALPDNVRRAVAQAFNVRYLGGQRFTFDKPKAGKTSVKKGKVQS